MSENGDGDAEAEAEAEGGRRSCRSRTPSSSSELSESSESSMEKEVLFRESDVDRADSSISWDTSLSEDELGAEEVAIFIAFIDKKEKEGKGGEGGGSRKKGGETFNQ